jgi:hypothetical protein
VARLANGGRPPPGRQRIGIGAQRDRRPGKLAGDHRDDASAGDRARREADRAQALGDELRRLDLAAGELGVLMQVPAPLDQLALDRRRPAVDLGGERVGTCRACGIGASGARRWRGRDLEREKRGKGKVDDGAMEGRVGHGTRL